MAGQVACVDRHGYLWMQQLGMHQRAFCQLRQEPGGQVVDAVETVVFKDIESGAFARAGAAADDDQAHGSESVLGVDNDLVQRLAVRGLAQTLADVGTVEHAGDLAEQFQVFVGRRFRHQQDEQQVDRRAIDGVEIDGCFQMENRTQRAAAATQAAVRNGDAVAEAG